MLISEIMDRYRVALRDTYNHHFRGDGFLEDQFFQVDEVLFQAMVLDRVEDMPDALGAYQKLQFTARHRSALVADQSEDGGMFELTSQDRVAYMRYVELEGQWHNSEFVLGRIVGSPDKARVGVEVIARCSEIVFLGDAEDDD